MPDEPVITDQAKPVRQEPSVDRGGRSFSLSELLVLVTVLGILLVPLRSAIPRLSEVPTNEVALVGIACMILGGIVGFNVGRARRGSLRESCIGSLAGLVVGLFAASLAVAQPGWRSLTGAGVALMVCALAVRKFLSPATAGDDP